MIDDRYAAPEETLEEARAPLYGIALGLLLGVACWVAVALLVWVVGRAW